MWYDKYKTIKKPGLLEKLLAHCLEFSAQVC